MTTYRLICGILLTVIHACSPREQQYSNTISKINYGYNIVVATDLSNRILNTRHYADPEIIELVTQNLQSIFKKSIDVGINSKFYLTSINEKDFSSYRYSDSVFKIDLNRFSTDAVSRSDYMFHNAGKRNSLQYDIETLNSTFRNFYSRRIVQEQLGADMWYFLKDRLVSPVIDTSGWSYKHEGHDITNRYNNYIILITDGYIEAGRYSGDPSMSEGNKTRFFSKNTINEFRNNFRAAGGGSIENYFSKNNYGIIPVENEFLANCKILVIELYDRSLVNGQTTLTPPDLDIMKMFWKDWLIKSHVKPSNIQLQSTMTNKQDLNTVLKAFFDIK